MWPVSSLLSDEECSYNPPYTINFDQFDTNLYIIGKQLLCIKATSITVIFLFVLNELKWGASQMSTHQLERERDELRLKKFGEELANARQRKGFPQLKLAAELDLGGTGPVVAWEKGRRRPQIQTLTKLSQLLGSSYAEEVYWRGLTGYLPPTQIPTQAQIKEGLEPYAHYIANYPYPAYILDNRFLYWVVNFPTAELVGSQDYLLQLLSHKTTVFQAIFDSRLGISQRASNLESIQLEQIRRFKGVNLFRRHEWFYQDYPECMKPILQKEDYDTFEKHWNTVNEVKNNFNIDEYMLSQHTRAVLGQIEYNTGNRTIHFQLTVEVLYSFGNIFTLIRYIPISELQSQNSHMTSNSGYYALWDHVDVDALLEDYRKSS